MTGGRVRVLRFGIGCATGNIYIDCKGILTYLRSHLLIRLLIKSANYCREINYRYYLCNNMSGKTLPIFTKYKI